jgi:hypothetical protein
MLYHAMTEEAGLLSQHAVISLVFLVKNLYLIRSTSYNLCLKTRLGNLYLIRSTSYNLYLKTRLGNCFVVRHSRSSFTGVVPKSR